MPSTDEPYYCSEQIKIPPELPDILKQFTKAAIKTQPKDVLAWSASYFRAMANGEIPPVKERIEMPVATQKTDTGLTKGLLRVLNRQLGPKKQVPLALIGMKWADLLLPRELFDDLVRIGNFNGTIEWNKFLALAASSLATNITSSLRYICEVSTHDPDGGSAKVPFSFFLAMYKYLALVDGDIPRDAIKSVEDYLSPITEKQNNFIMPRNFENSHCPNLAGKPKIVF